MEVEKPEEETALRKLEEGNITLWKVAEISKLPLWEIHSLVEEENISIPVNAREIISDISAGGK